MNKRLSKDELVEMHLRAIEETAKGGLMAWREGFVAINPDPIKEREWRVSRVNLHLDAAKGHISDLESLLG
jgi:hypothetical protein